MSCDKCSNSAKKILDDMGTQELSHVDVLHEQAVRLIQAQRSEGKEVPAGMQAVWDWEHSHMMDRVARIKVLLDNDRR